MARGYKTGGKQRGTPNRATTERLERERVAQQAQQEVDKARQANTKLGKDVLEEFMKTFAGMAAYYQPVPDGIAVPDGRNGSAKLTALDVAAIRVRLEAGARSCDLAKEYSITRSNIAEIKARRTWRHI